MSNSAAHRLTWESVWFASGRSILFRFTTWLSLDAICVPGSVFYLTFFLVFFSGYLFVNTSQKPHAEWSGCGFCCSYAVISNIPPPPHQAAGQYGGTPGSNPMSWRLIAHPIDSYALRASSILLSGLTSIHLDLFPP